MTTAMNSQFSLPLPRGQEGSGSSLFVTRISVEQLFGQFTYTLPATQATEADLSKLLILYGDNGSGKTTLLKLIFHLLSPATNRDHRSSIGRIRFKSFSVQLGSEITITARREGDELLGSYRMTISVPSAPAASVVWEFDNRLRVVKGNRKPITDMLGRLNLKIHFLPDDRKIVTDLMPDDDEDFERGSRANLLVSHLSHQRAIAEEEESSLAKAIRRAVDWIRRQAISGSGAGEINANTIYTDIVKRIASPYSSEPQTENPDLNTIISELEEQAKRTSLYSRYGLTSELAIDELIAALKSTKASRHAGMLEQILRPYIDGIRARLDALQATQKAVSTFVETMNAFYRQKNISFNLRDGITIQSKSGEQLNPNALSSGEKQLLLLFCNVLGAADQPSVFLIDEPELSLNVKWQRKLVDALLECTQQSRTQFILATHSLELLTQHNDNVLQLTSIE